MWQNWFFNLFFSFLFTQPAKLKIESIIYTFFFKNINPKCCCSILKFRNQPILRFDVILQHDWPIEQCLLHIRVFFGGKTNRPCFDLFIHWLIKHLTNTYRDHFSRPYENRCMWINQNLATINKFLNFWTAWSLNSCTVKVARKFNRSNGWTDIFHSPRELSIILSLVRQQNYTCLTFTSCCSCDWF